ncbi:DNase I-like protein [Auriculariales sp. MPI-PUGE-AT-0066]|nr:DNase I-like protein [Auriculariales sp. MPI-PUGE-AT-0066]
MRILTWNINGLRTLPQYHPWNTMKSWARILDALEASIICFQEMKTSRQQLDRSVGVPDGYDSFFSFPVSKGGYSGVAVYTRRSDAVPLKAEEGLTSRLQPKPPLTKDERVSNRYPDIDDFQLDEYDDGTVPGDVLELDNEGRALVLDFGMFVLFNLYCPAETVDTRIPYKMNFHRLLRERVQILLDEGREVIIVGDINICAEPIDHCDYTVPSTHHAFYERPIRAWMRDFLQPDGPFVDVVRRQWPDRKSMYTCWNTRIGARDSNYGTRLDYFLCTPGLLPWIKHGDIQPLVKGSDHCPVYVDLHEEIVTESGVTLRLVDMMQQTAAPNTPPRIASCYWDQFLGKQTLLSKFFGKGATAKVDTPTAASEQIPVLSPTTDTSKTMKEDAQTDGLAFSLSQASDATTVADEFPPSSQPSSSTVDVPRTSFSSSISTPAKVSKKRKPGQMKMSSFFKQPKLSATSSPSQAESSSGHFESQQIDEDYELALRLAAADEERVPSPPKTTEKAKSAWTSLLAPVQPPNCDVHKEPGLRKTTTKPGPNKGKVFYVCSRPLGPGWDNGKDKRLRSEVDPQYKCDFFKWETDVKRASLRQNSDPTQPSSSGRRKLTDP